MTKSGLLSAAGLALAFGVFGASQPSMAVTLTIDGSGTPYVENGFQIDPISINSGNCDGASGAPCLALSPTDTSTLTRVGGGAFTLSSFGFELLGDTSELTVKYSDGTTQTYDVTNTIKPPSCTPPYAINCWYVVSGVSNITSVIFSDTGEGNIRIDDINVLTGDPAPAPVVTPLPGALPLFVSGIGALGLFGWRKRRKAAVTA
jgi:hypothetical protein